MSSRITINDKDIERTEKKILPEGYSFSDETRNAIRELGSKNIVACPGSGKTTMLLSKISILVNQLPFEDNKGICVLSHTNVAVNEIRKKISDVGQVLKQYPNYVGTIQSFIHKFIVFPFLTSIYHVRPRILKNEEYNKLLYKILCERKDFRSLKGLVENNVKNSDKDITEEEFLSKIYIDFNDSSKLKAKGIRRNFGNVGSKSNKQFKKLKNAMWRKGFISYADAYILTGLAMKSNGDALSKIISKRFKYVFIDEYQDCSNIQCEIIQKLFSNEETNLQKIGDPDQAIYTSHTDIDVQWDYEENYLPISGSRRYGDKIANIISRLRLDRMEIESHANTKNLKPYLIVFQSESVENVIPKFAQVIEEHDLHEKNKPVFKAVGMIRNGSGLKISDYWGNDKITQTINDKQTLLDCLLELWFAIDSGSVKKLLVIVYQILSKVVSASYNKNISPSKVEKDIKNSEHINDFKEAIIKLINVPVYEDVAEYVKAAEYIVKNEIYYLTNMIFEIEINVNDNFNEINTNNINDMAGSIDEIESNKYIHKMADGNEIDIEVSTVHKVKGETHTATLYMETELSRSSDLKRVLPLIGGKKLGSSNIYKKSRKIVYVGFSRPSDLLCVAIKSDTYDKFISLFDEQWEIIKI